MTGKLDLSGLSHREVKIDVSQYFQKIVMGLYAVCEEKLDNQDRALRPSDLRLQPITLDVAS